MGESNRKPPCCLEGGVGEPYSRDKGWGVGVFQNLAKDPIVVFYIASNFKLSISSKLHRGVTLFTCVQAFSIGMQSRLLQPMRPKFIGTLRQVRDCGRLRSRG